MKTRIICALAAVMAFSSVSDACHKGHHSKAVKGRVTSVGSGKLNLASANNQNFTVDYSSATVSGTRHRVIDASVVGSMASVTGNEDGDVITASHITISESRRRI